MKTASAITWLHCICQNQGTNRSSHLTFPSLHFLSLFFSSFSPICPPFIVFPRLASPAPPLPSLDCPHRVEDLLADPDPTHKRRVDNQLPLSSGLNWSSSEFLHDVMPSESGLLLIIPHLVSHSSLIFGSLIPTPLGFCASTPPQAAVARWTAFSSRRG